MTGGTSCPTPNWRSTFDSARQHHRLARSRTLAIQRAGRTRPGAIARSGRHVHARDRIHTREHFSVLPVEQRPFSVDNPWFQGTAALPVYHFDELLGTKMRALYQRKKGRDLYDLWVALQAGKADRDRLLECFNRYMDHDGLTVSRAQYGANLAAKLNSVAFREDVQLLVSNDASYDPVTAWEYVHAELISRLPGEPWKEAG